MNALTPSLHELARVPRTLTPLLEPLIPEDHPWSWIGARIIAGGLLAALIAGALALFGALPWASLALGASVMIVGWLMRRVVRERSIRAGRKRLARLPLSLVTVVQANNILFDREEATLAPAVIAYARGSLAQDASFMLNIARHIGRLRDAPTGDPELDRIGALLADEQSHFVERVPSRLTGSTEVTLHTTFLDPDKIPGGYLHESSVLACFLDDDGGLFQLLPANAYS